VSNGTETTTAAIGFTLYRLAGDPVLQSWLSESSGQIGRLVEEILLASAVSAGSNLPGALVPLYDLG
jgi:cytochrome P450